MMHPNRKRQTGEKNSGNYARIVAERRTRRALSSAASIVVVVVIVAIVAGGVAVGSAMGMTGVPRTVTSVHTLTTVQTVTASGSSDPATVTLQYKQGIGFYLANSTGSTLYLRTTDGQGSGTSSCTGGCVAIWPVFYSPTITSGPGVNASLFGTITRSDGSKQTTYNGWPLYYFVKDTKPGEVNGEGIANVWFACCSIFAGNSSTTSASSTSAASTSSSTSSASTTMSHSGAAASPIAISIASGASTSPNTIGYSESVVTLVVGVNNTVTWTNKDITQHTVTSSSVPAGAQAFDSGPIMPGQTFTQTFTVPGTYEYHCSFHPWMKAMVIVK